MARHVFGGTTDFAAEEASGARLPNGHGQVYDGPTDTAQQLTDLVDMQGNPITILTADQNGMVPAFYGPDGYTELWVDFGPGKYGVTPVDTSQLLQDHVTGTDPHGDRAYTDQKLQGYLPTTGGTVSVDDKRTGIEFAVPADDTTGTAFTLTNGDGTYTRLLNSGALCLDVVNAKDHVPLLIGTKGASADGVVLLVSDDVAGAGGQIASVQKNGTATFKGKVVAQNVGGARVYSGPKPPADPLIGDVWIQYG